MFGAEPLTTQNHVLAGDVPHNLHCVPLRTNNSNEAVASRFLFPAGFARRTAPPDPKGIIPPSGGMPFLGVWLRLCRRASAARERKEEKKEKR
jgi:hypothetical protein